MSTRYGQAEGRVVVTGGVRSHTQLDQGALDVPGYLEWVYPANIRAISQLDTNSYGWSWLVDGTPVSNPDARIVVQLSPGSHTIKALAMMADQLVDTMSATVFVHLSAAISGPSQVAPYESNTWSAAIPAGSPPYSYEWWDGGNYLGSDGEVTLSFTPAPSTHLLEVHVTDSQGNTGTTSYQVTVTSCDPNDPNCGDTNRTPRGVTPLSRRRAPWASYRNRTCTTTTIAEELP